MLTVVPRASVVYPRSNVKIEFPNGYDARLKEESLHGPFRPYERLVEITILGKRFQVPERNSLLRCFQFISPENDSLRPLLLETGLQYCRRDVPVAG